MLVPQVTRYPVLLRADLERGFLFNMLGADVFRARGFVVARSARVVVPLSLIHISEPTRR